MQPSDQATRRKMLLSLSPILVVFIGTVQISRGQGATLRLSPPKVIFGGHAIGAPSSPRTVTVTNTGAAKLTIGGIFLAGGFPDDFSLGQNICAGATLAPAASCTLRVSFAPKGAGARTAALVVTGGAGGLSSLALAGTGAGSCGGISDCAYLEITKRVTANQSSFFVYKDADSAFNHGFSSGYFASQDIALTSIEINAACIDNPADTATGCFPSNDVEVIDETRGTVLSLTIPSLPLPQDFAGVNFVDPENYSPAASIIGNGYDLTGAMKLQFDIRSPNGMMVQFGVGGCVTEFFPIGPYWATMTIALDSLFPPPGGSSSPCPPDLTDVHILFTVTTNGAQAQGGGTVLLDNVEFTPAPTRQTTDKEALSLPLSTQTFGVVPQSAGPAVPAPPPCTWPQKNLLAIPSDQANRNVAAIYESALTILSLLKRGQPADVSNALEIANALDYALNHDNHGDPVPAAPDGSRGLHDAYMSGDIALLNNQASSPGLAGDVRLAGFECGSAGFCLVLDGATGGNNAWAILALAAAYLESDDITYLNDAETIGHWIRGALTDNSPESYGGYFVGFNDGSNPPHQPNYGKSTENNADIFAAFSLLAQIETSHGNTVAASNWTAWANWAGDFVMRMFNSANGNFNTGTVTLAAADSPGGGNCPDLSQTMGNDVVNTSPFIDANTFTTLPMAAAQRYQDNPTGSGSAMDWRLPLQFVLDLAPPASYIQSVTAAGIAYQGFDLIPAPPASGVAFEFTGQMTETCEYLDALLNTAVFASCGEQYLKQIRQAQISAPFADGMGLVASILQNGDTLTPLNQCISTPFQCIPERVGLAATNWAIIADQGFNPMAFASANFFPSSLSFPNQLVGSSATLSLKLASIGTAPLAITGAFAITGVNAADFQESDNCAAQSVLAPGATCAIQVDFTPSAAGTRTATLTITDTALGSPQMVALTGMGLPSDDFSLSASPGSETVVAGGSVMYGVSTAILKGSPQTITLSVEGLPSGATATFYPNPLPAGATTAMTVSVSPYTLLGSYPLVVTATNVSTRHTVSVIAVVLSPVNPSEPSLSFGTQLLGARTSHSLSLYNAAPTVVTVGSILSAGWFSGDYTQINGCGTYLGPGATCAVDVTFTPSGTGPRAAVLLVIDNTGNTLQSIPLIGEGEGGCANISNCAYREIDERATASQNGFFVYQDADSSLNHGFPSGFFGDLSAIEIDAGCVNDPQDAEKGCFPSGSATLDGSRGTVFRLSFVPLPSGNYAGVNIEEPEKWGVRQTGVGYDLTGASSVVFDVRSPGGITVQFGVGECTTPSIPLPASPAFTTMTVHLNSLTAPAPGITCPPNIANTHVLFSVSTSDTAGGTVLLDNIHFTPLPIRQLTTPSLPLSTQTLGTVPLLDYPTPTDQVNRNLSTVYESALSVLAMLKGQSTDVTSAMAILNGLHYARQHENHGDPLPVAKDGSVGLHSGYESGDLPFFNDQAPPKLGRAGDVRLAGFTASESLCGSSSFCLVLDGATGGNNAWAILALGAGYLQSGNLTYLNDAEGIGNWIVGTLVDKSSAGYGGYFDGFSDGGQPKVLLLGKSTQDNAVIFAALSLLAQIEAGRGNSAGANQWTASANWAGDFVMKMFDTVNGRFYAGTLDSVFLGNPGPGVCPSRDPSQQQGSDLINTCNFLDSDLFTTLAMASSQRYRNDPIISNNSMNWLRPLQNALGPVGPDSFLQSVTAAGLSFQGVDLVPAPPASGIAWEFTGQMAETCNYLDSLENLTAFQNCGRSYVGQILQAQGSAPFGDGLGITASTLQNGDTLPPANECFNTPFECVPERVGLAATSWAIFADHQINPFASAAPALASLSPASAPPAAPPFTLTVTGANFAFDSVAQWNGASLPTTYVSGTQLTAQVPASDIAASTTAQVTVLNSSPVSVVSNALAFTVIAQPTINPGGTVSGASFNGLPTPGSITSVFGRNFGSSTATAGALPLPPILNDVSLAANGLSAPLFAVSPQQINFQMPWETQGQSQASLTVGVDGVTSPATPVNLSAYNPGLFSINQQGSGQGAVQIANTAILAAPTGSVPGVQTHPAKAGEYITIYCTGLGPVTNQPPTGMPASASPLSKTETTPVLTIGGASALITFSGLAPSFVGLYQVNAQIPSNAPTGTAVPLALRIGGSVSNTVTIAIE